MITAFEKERNIFSNLSKYRIKALRGRHFLKMHPIEVKITRQVYFFRFGSPGLLNPRVSPKVISACVYCKSRSMVITFSVHS